MGGGEVDEDEGKESMKNMTLLEKAKSSAALKTSTSSSVTSEHKELATAFIRGEIRIGDVSTALGRSPTYSYSLVCKTVKAMHQNGELTINLQPK